MSISTKGGDKGMTSLWSGERVWKDDARVDAYGTLDELDAHLGEAKHYVKIEKIREIIEIVQNELMKVMGELAALSKEYLIPLTQADVDRLTNYVHEFESIVQLKGFVIPGNTIQSAKLDVCRTIARRAERRIISLQRQTEVDPLILQYVNRLSDLCFIMARAEEKAEGKIKCKQDKPCQDS
ncbi:MAG: cob(I)yrinic acid a,c-diamide adenosyltransferase [Candidatus Cloacimonetes bacterium]|nr:cob(I)yrinic acid a,c-diamide adenosyltransferase [Candidatus Cloacimonadota bacterium]